jgi:hypothetical protein
VCGGGGWSVVIGANSLRRAPEATFFTCIAFRATFMPEVVPRGVQLAMGYLRGPSGMINQSLLLDDTCKMT